MTPIERFDRHADMYERHNLMQRRVAAALAERVPPGCRRPVDLGCGSGTLYRALGRPFARYLAVDASEAMLARHPDGPAVRKMVGNFDESALFDTLRAEEIDAILSASALQWAKDLDWTLGRIAALGHPVALAIFTAGTFATLHVTAGTRPPIRTLEETKTLVEKHFDAETEVLRDTLTFPDTPAMLAYIRDSGVSGGRNLAGYRAVRKILRDYPLDYLEFEVLLAVGKPKGNGEWRIEN